jgi:hypothetical protein
VIRGPGARGNQSVPYRCFDGDPAQALLLAVGLVRAGLWPGVHQTRPGLLRRVRTGRAGPGTVL